MICSCGLRVQFTPETAVGAMVSDYSYLFLANCACGSTRAAVLWDAEDDEFEAIAAE
jgi:hypothetical protein